MLAGQGTSNTRAPDFVGLAGHPVRWRLLTELARSDRHVNELTRLLGQPQALISYHLGRLRDGGLVSSRRSRHDRRASYYTIDLRRCAEALSVTGSRLHPGLSLHLAPVVAPQRRSSTRLRVLFACTGNGARSQIAEALLQRLAGDRLEVVSGGSHPKPIHPNVTRVLAERGIDISGRRSKQLSQFEGQHFDVVVTLCDRVREACPEFFSRADAIHWSIEDPSLATGDNRATYPVFCALAAELESRIGFLNALIHQHEHEQETTNHVRP